MLGAIIPINLQFPKQYAHNSYLPHLVNIIRELVEVLNMENGASHKHVLLRRAG